eukprot:TRINITY_DN2692_c0_g1_i3.p1 TRINITY_DN2692_c0_g1~~TRINITY_DN2692_c0_g1_i3.p1  ORF type:complete len:159 (-),score=29.41 TRINITY_DN2692_c0_g1_i3:151-627(-)
MCLYDMLETCAAHTKHMVVIGTEQMGASVLEELRGILVKVDTFVCSSRSDLAHVQSRFNAPTMRGDLIACAISDYTLLPTLMEGFNVGQPIVVLVIGYRGWQRYTAEAMAVGLDRHCADLRTVLLIDDSEEETVCRDLVLYGGVVQQWRVQLFYPNAK